MESRILFSSAVQLFINQGPVNSICGSTLAPISVELETVGGTIADDSSTVTLTLNGGKFSDGSNVTSVAAVHGVATFSKLDIDCPGQFTLTARDASLVASTSLPFTVYWFNCINSFPANAGPNSSLTVDANGDLFGTTAGGGNGGTGSSFVIAFSSNSITTLSSYDTSSGAAATPAPVYDSYGNAYVISRDGGPSNQGAIYELPYGATSQIALATFNGANGAFPNGLTLDSAGDLFGTTAAGGANGGGTVFELASSARLTFTQPVQPAAPGATINPLNGGIPVAVGDIFGHAFTASSDAVTLTLQGGTFVGGKNPVSVAAVNGVATFSDLAVADSGSYSIVASDDNIINGSTAAKLDVISPVPNWASGSAATWNAATDTLEVTGPGVTINEDPNADTETLGGSPVTDPNIIVDAGQTLHIKPSSAISSSGVSTYTVPSSGQLVHLGGLTLDNGANTIVDSLGASRSASNHVVLVVGTGAAAPTFDVANGKLDMTDNDLIIHNGNLATVQADAAIGRNVAPGGVFDGPWNGGGLSSSAAHAAFIANGSSEVTVLAVVQNSEQLLGQLNAWVVGSKSETLSGSDIIVKYTYNGDFALEGFVGDDSSTIFALNYDPNEGTGHDWAGGDANGDGTADDTDATIFSIFYGNGTGGASGNQL